MLQKTIILIALWALATGAALAANDDDAAMSKEAAEAELAELSKQIRELSRRMSTLSMAIADVPLNHVFRASGGFSNKAVLGIGMDLDDEPGVRVLGVTPGGPAEKAGVRSGDVIVSLNGTTIDKDRDLITFMDDVKVGDRLDVGYTRDGARYAASLTTEPLAAHPAMVMFSGDDDFDFQFEMPEMPEMPDMAGFEKDVMDRVHTRFAFRFGSAAWSDMELVELTPALGDYFGVREGLLVVRAPKSDSLALTDGDVITKFNGRPVTSPRQFNRSLRATAAGETVDMEIVRQRRSMTLSAQVPKGEQGSWRTPGDKAQIHIEKHHTDDD